MTEGQFPGRKGKRRTPPGARLFTGTVIGEFQHRTVELLDSAATLMNSWAG